ncbi:MAG TPA: ABC transporter permease [Prolixibacteraceae bacterium]|nr:ABC transporter permease [Prolixibacteraceae bacterium]
MKDILKSTYRNFIRKPATNLINLGGLAISLALVIVLSVYSYSELTTDSFHKNASRLYVYSDFSPEHTSLHTPAILKDQIDLNIPEVESAVRVAGTWEEPVFQVEKHDPITSDIVTADPGFFKAFTYEAAEGNLETALNDPMTIALSEPLARKLFGNESALGKSLKINNKQNLTVTAVFKQQKNNSCMSFSAITSNDTRKIVYPNQGEFSEWGWWNFNLFVLLKDGANPAETAKKIAALFPKDERENQNYRTYQLNHFTDLYFSNFTSSWADYLHCGDKQKVMILLLVAALVLMIALVNFINISSSQWFEKIKQTGVLKVIGANKTSIMKSVLAEAFVLFLAALFLATIIVQLSFQSICSYTGIHFDPLLIYKPSVVALSVLGIFALSLIFSIIPAIQIANSKAVDNLKKSIKNRPTNSFSRGILATAQFAIAIVLIAFTVLVQKQVNFGNSNFNLGKENVIGIKLTPQLSASKDVLKKTLQDNPYSGKISFSQFFPGKLNEHWTSNQKIEGKEIQLNFDTFNGDANLCSILGLQLVQGRFFSEDLVTDAHKMVVNETFIREHKMTNPIGAKFVMGFGENPPLSEIIGVVKDFRYKPVTVPVGSLIIQNEPRASYCLVTLNAKDFNSLNHFIQDIKTETNKLSPSFPVEISFLDQAVEHLYQSEIQFRRTFSLFAGSAIVICCLGILAMSLFACQQRIKEIGIRKVNGAKVSDVMAMLNRDFVRWVVVAFIIATPIAWYTMNKWLESYAYKTEMSWWIFALAGILALGIALLTVSWQSWKAATRNPVEALRYE